MKIKGPEPIEKLVEDLFNEVTKSSIPWIRRALED
jgi:hypothetical protein